MNCLECQHPEESHEAIATIAVSGRCLVSGCHCSGFQPDIDAEED